MKSSVVIITLFLLFSIISCSPAKQDSNQNKQVPVLPSVQEQPAPASTEAAQPAEEVTPQQPAAQQNNAEVMLNPPHGQPFHRCDIPVGAPLPSQSAGTATQTSNSQVQVNTPQVTAPAARTTTSSGAPTIENARRMNTGQAQSTAPANSGSKPALNPPHGQPYHRCDIAVGSPLP
jgi:hypothetical protein